MALQRFARIAFTLGALVVVIVSLLPGEEVPDVGLWDKLEHALAYAALAIVGGIAWAGSARAWGRLGVGLTSLGLVLEFLQSFVPGRLTDAGDAFANVVGTLLGLGLVAVLGRIGGRAARIGKSW